MAGKFRVLSVLALALTIGAVSFVATATGHKKPG